MYRERLKHGETPANSARACSRRSPDCQAGAISEDQGATALTNYVHWLKCKVRERRAPAERFLRTCLLGFGKTHCPDSFDAEGTEAAPRSGRVQAATEHRDW